MDRINEIILRLGDKVRVGSTCSDGKKRINNDRNRGRILDKPGSYHFIIIQM